MLVFCSHAWNFRSDLEKLCDILKRNNVMPLGSGALAGNPFGIDRTSLAEELGFTGITENSMQAVSDRDFIGKLCSKQLQNVEGYKIFAAVQHNSVS